MSVASAASGQGLVGDNMSITVVFGGTRFAYMTVIILSTELNLSSSGSGSESRRNGGPGPLLDEDCSGDAWMDGGWGRTPRADISKE